MNFQVSLHQNQSLSTAMELTLCGSTLVPCENYRVSAGGSTLVPCKNYRVSAGGSKLVPFGNYRASADGCIVVLKTVERKLILRVLFN